MPEWMTGRIIIALIGLVAIMPEWLKALTVGETVGWIIRFDVVVTAILKVWKSQCRGLIALN